MRKETRVALGVVGLSALTTSYLLGQQPAQQAMSLSATTISTENKVAVTESASPAPSETSDSSTPEPAASPAQSAQAGEPAAEPAPTTAQPTEPAVSPATNDGTYTSGAIAYKFGTMQLEVTIASGVLTNINLLQASTEGRGYDQAPPILVEAAIGAGGSNFGNLSGATFTTEAFKQALDDALSQAGM